jgi:hypothetical protein
MGFPFIQVGRSPAPPNTDRSLEAPAPPDRGFFCLGTPLSGERPRDRQKGAEQKSDAKETGLVVGRRCTKPGLVWHLKT